MISLSFDIIHEAFYVADEILDAAGVPSEKKLENNDKIKRRLEAFAKAILEQAGKQSARSA